MSEPNKLLFMSLECWTYLVYFQLSGQWWRSIKSIIHILTLRVVKTQAIWNYIFVNEVCSIICKIEKKNTYVWFCSYKRCKMKATEKPNLKNLNRNSLIGDWFEANICFDIPYSAGSLLKRKFKKTTTAAARGTSLNKKVY